VVSSPEYSLPVAVDGLPNFGLLQEKTPIVFYFFARRTFGVCILERTVLLIA
jgi:hypothetical protein